MVPMVVKIVREYMRELLKVQTLTPGSFPVYPLLTLLTTLSWNLEHSWTECSGNRKLSSFSFVANYAYKCEKTSRFNIYGVWPQHVGTKFNHTKFKFFNS